MELVVKHFSELNAEELFEIYKLRVSVFIVEQACPYQDIDGADMITIEAQTYARGLYENLGFRQTSEEFLEDGIPHIQMQLEL